MKEQILEPLLRKLRIKRILPTLKQIPGIQTLGRWLWMGSQTLKIGRIQLFYSKGMTDIFSKFNIMFSSTKIKVFLLSLLALFFTWLWIQSGEPDIREARLITQTTEKSIKYPFENLGLKNGEYYTITFKSRSTANYLIKSNDSLLSIAAAFGHNEPVHIMEQSIFHNLSDRITPYFDSFTFELNFQHVGATRAFDIEVSHNKFTRSFFISFFIIFFLLALVVLRQIINISKLVYLSSIFSMFILVCIGFSEFSSNIVYELKGPLNIYDSGIFLAMGRAIANGLKYYTDISEIKPPGFYFFIAIVIKFFGDAKPMHFFQALVLFSIALFPILAYLKIAKEKNIWFCGISILLGLLLALYSGDRAGEVMIESFGACVGAIAVFFMALPKFEQKKKIYIPIIALAMLGSCGMKEPFFFVILASSLFLAQNIKDWCFKFLLPFAIACVLGLTILFATGIFEGYLDYLKFMSTTHTNSNGSPWVRMLQIQLLSANMNMYAWGLGIFFIALLLVLFINIKNKIHLLWQMPCAIILTSLAVGAGGEYYNHHFIFALPFYFAMWFLFLQNNTENSKVKKMANTVLVILLAFAVFNLPAPNWKSKLQANHMKQLPAKLEALYLDAVMDVANIDRYMVIEGLSGNLAFAYTRHSPVKSIIWDPRAWERIPGALDDYIDDITKVQIISFKSIKGFPIEYQRKIIDILENEFTPEPWENVAEIPRPEGLDMLILFRKKQIQQ